MQGEERKTCYKVAEQMRSLNYYARFSPIVGKICEDFEVFKEVRLTLDLEGDPLKDPTVLAKMARKKINEQAVHGIRFAAMIELFEQAVQMPDLLVQKGLEQDQIVQSLLSLNGIAVDRLYEIFKAQAVSKEVGAGHDFGSPVAFGNDLMNSGALREEDLKSVAEHLGLIQQAIHPLIQLGLGVG